MRFPVVMVVDDEPGMLALLESWLRKQGFAAVKAHSAEIALHLLNSFKPDLLLIDLLMPDINGIELCRMIRAIPHVRNTPIIIITAYENNWDKMKQAEAAGANAFLSKLEISGSGLRSQIHSLLGLKPSECSASSENNPA